MKILLTILALFFCVESQAAKPLYTFFTGSPKGTYTQVANDIEKACPNLNIQVQTTQGTLANINSLLLGPQYKAGNRIAFVQQDALEIMAGEIPKIKHLYKLVTPLYDEEIVIIANKNSGIHSVKDLAGKRVSIGQTGAGSWFTSSMIQRKLRARWVGYEHSIEESMLMVLTGQIDAALVVGGVPLPIFTELGKGMDNRIVMIPIYAPELDKLYKTIKIPAKTYEWADYPIDTKSTMSLMIAASDVKDKDIKELKSCLVKNLPAIQKFGHPKWKQISQHIHQK